MAANTDTPPTGGSNQPTPVSAIARLVTRTAIDVPGLMAQLGPAVLIGHLGPKSANAPVLVPQLEGLEQLGISLDMLCWGLVLRGVGNANRSGIRLGRAPSNDVHLDAPSVSKLHARISMQPEGAMLLDLGSLTGTIVRGVRLRPDQPAILRDHDVIQLGELRLRHLRTETLHRVLQGGSALRKVG